MACRTRLSLATALAAAAWGCGDAAPPADALAATSALEAGFTPARPPDARPSRALEPFLRPPQQTGGLRVPVRLSEWEVVLPGRLPAGLVTFLVRNRGHEDHAFHIWGRALDRQTRVIEPGMRAALTVRLARGVYHVECPVKKRGERDSHAKMGMTGTIHVY